MRMFAQVLQQPRGPLVPMYCDIPPIGPHDLLLSVLACGVCRTDLHICDGELTGCKLPLIPGHEIVGRVVACGEVAEGFRVGDRAGVPWLGMTCGKCQFCVAGQENLCDTPEFTGYSRDGGYAEYVVADSRYCVHLPPTYGDAAAAPLLCAGLIGYRALTMTGPAERLGIFGFGAAAHIIAQVAKYQGRRVFAFTRPGDAEGQAFARKLGCEWAGSSEERPPEALDASIVFAPVGSLVPQALQSVRKGGTVVCGGIHMSDIPSFPYSLLWGERTLRSVAHLTRRDAQEFLRIAPQIPIHTEVETYPMNQAGVALDRVRQGLVHGAAVLVPMSAVPGANPETHAGLHPVTLPGLGIGAGVAPPMGAGIGPGMGMGFGAGLGVRSPAFANAHAHAGPHPGAPGANGGHVVLDPAGSDLSAAFFGPDALSALGALATSGAKGPPPEVPSLAGDVGNGLSAASTGSATTYADGTSHDAWALVVSSLPTNRHEVARVLEDVLHEPHADATAHAAHMPGILPLGATRREAQDLVRRLTQCGLVVRLVPQHELPDFSKPATVHHGYLTYDGWELRDLQNRVSEVVPWTDLVLMHVGELPERDESERVDFHDTWLSMGSQRRSVTSGLHATRHVEAWVACRNPMRAYRCHEKQMNYHELGERRVDSASVNFMTYLNDFVQLCKHLRLTPETQAFLGRRSRDEYEARDGRAMRAAVEYYWVKEQLEPHEPAVHRPH